MARYACFGYLVAVLPGVAACDVLWPLDGKYDPRRCDPACAGELVCVDGKCRTPGTGPGPDASTASDMATVDPAVFKNNVDILVVIDNSPSMGGEQNNLNANLPKLIEALRNDRLGPDESGEPCSATARDGCTIPNVHIGVISSDLGAGNYTLPSCEVPGGDKGRLQVTPRTAGCTPPSKNFVSFIDGVTNVPNTDPKNPIQAVKDAFGCIAKLGTSGCAFAHHMESARRALDPLQNTNPGFLRDEALLVVVFITDKDDCSAANPQLFDPTQTGLTDPLGPLTSFRCFEFGMSCDLNGRIPGPRTSCFPAQDWLYPIKGQYEDFFRALKRPGGVIIAAIAGPTDRVEVGLDNNKPTLMPSCSTAAGLAVPSIRIDALVEAFKPDSAFTSICEGDFGPAFAALGEKIHAKLGL